MRHVGMLLLMALIAGSTILPARAAPPPCQLCVSETEGAAARAARPIHIDIDTAIDFATAAHTGAGRGTITLDPRTGQRSFSGLIGLGGAALRGTVVITGEPFRRVNVELPAMISLNAAGGGKAEIVDFRTTLSPDPRIGADGRLSFSFGGRLSVRDGATGDFRGRIQIRAEYQ